MAALESDQYDLLHMTGDTLKLALYRVKGVTTEDTVDLAVHFRNVQEAAFFCATDFPGIPASLPTLSGTTVTFGQFGMANDGGYLMVMGLAR